MAAIACPICATTHEVNAPDFQNGEALPSQGVKRMDNLS